MGRFIGFQARRKISRADLVKRLEQATGTKPRMIPGGPAICRNLGVVTGGAGGDLQQATEEGVDMFITGEGPHWTYALAEASGVNVFYGGYYARGTFGVKTLAAHLAEKLRSTWTFIDHPTWL